MIKPGFKNVKFMCPYNLIKVKRFALDSLISCSYSTKGFAVNDVVCSSKFTSQTCKAPFIVRC